MIWSFFCCCIRKYNMWPFQNCFQNFQGRYRTYLMSFWSSNIFPKKIRFFQFFLKFFDFFQKHEFRWKKWNHTAFSNMTTETNSYYFLMIFCANESWRFVLQHTVKRLSIKCISSHVRNFKRAEKSEIFIFQMKIKNRRV